MVLPCEIRFWCPSAFGFVMFCEDTQVRISPGAAARALERHYLARELLLPVLQFLNASGSDSSGRFRLQYSSDMPENVCFVVFHAGGPIFFYTCWLALASRSAQQPG